MVHTDRIEALSLDTERKDELRRALKGLARELGSEASVLLIGDYARGDVQSLASELELIALTEDASFKAVSWVGEITERAARRAYATISVMTQETLCSLPLVLWRTRDQSIPLLGEFDVASLPEPPSDPLGARAGADLSRMHEAIRQELLGIFGRQASMQRLLGMRLSLTIELLRARGDRVSPDVGAALIELGSEHEVEYARLTELCEASEYMPLSALLQAGEELEGLLERELRASNPQSAPAD